MSFRCCCGAVVVLVVVAATAVVGAVVGQAIFTIGSGALLVRSAALEIDPCQVLTWDNGFETSSERLCTRSGVATCRILT